MNTKITKRQEKKLGEASVIDYNKKTFEFFKLSFSLMK